MAVVLLPFFVTNEPRLREFAASFTLHLLHLCVSSYLPKRGDFYSKETFMNLKKVINMPVMNYYQLVFQVDLSSDIINRTFG